MAVLIDSDEYDDNQLGLTLYRVMALTIAQPEPWMLLDDDERQYYATAAKDFIRQLSRMQGNGRRKSKKKLWYFDFDDNKAKVKWFWCPNVAEPTKWIEPYTRNSRVFVLHKDVFLQRTDALTYGVSILKAYVAQMAETLSRVEEEASAAQDTDFLDDDEKQEWIWFDDEPETDEEPNDNDA